LSKKEARPMGNKFYLIETSRASVSLYA